MSDWQIGQEVELTRHGLVDSRIGRVTRLTKTLVMAQTGAKEYRFNIRTRGLVGQSSWGHCYIKPLTPERKRQIGAARARRYLRQAANWDAMSDDAVIGFEKQVRIVLDASPSSGESE